MGGRNLYRIPPLSGAFYFSCFIGVGPGLGLGVNRLSCISSNKPPQCMQHEYSKKNKKRCMESLTPKKPEIKTHFFLLIFIQ